jgi:putative ABC transport system substrate-binding protein
LLVVLGTVGGVAAKKLVTTKPVVFISVGAPIDIGLVENLSRPGGNITGITFEAATETYAAQSARRASSFPANTAINGSWRSVSWSLRSS